MPLAWASPMALPSAYSRSAISRAVRRLPRRYWLNAMCQVAVWISQRSPVRSSSRVASRHFSMQDSNRDAQYSTTP
jgi:hypothetical protein